jgi:hypothetical protein
MSWMMRFVLATLVLSSGCGLSEYPHVMTAPGRAEPPLPPAMPAPDAAEPVRDAGRDRASGRADARDSATTMPPPAPPPAASAAGAPSLVDGKVVIDGVPVPRDKIIVFLHLGHSNMAGRTSTPAELRPLNFETHPRLWAYAKGGTFRPAKEPLSGDYLTKGGAGPGMSILHAALDLAPQATHVSIGRGHDGSIGGYCRNFRKGALMYDFVMAPAMELRGKVTFGAIFTMLGVNEFRRDAANLTRFNECLAGIASDMRGDLGDPDIPFVMGDWEAGATGDFAPTHDYAITTKEQLRIAEMKIPRAVLIPSDMLPMSDDHHYDLTGYKLWAERGFALLKMKGWTPWAAQ